MYTPKIELGPHTVLRQAPRFELLLFDQLPDDARDDFAELASEPDLWGVARSRDDGSLLALGSDTALLLLTLQRPGPLPAFAYHDIGSEERTRRILKLVLDGLLEIQLEDHFLSGVAAFEKLGLNPSDDVADDLSRRALRYVAALDLDDVVGIGWRLYFFNRVPLSARWTQQLCSGKAVEEYLGLKSSTTSPLRARLMRHWKPGQSPKGWLSWQRRRNQRLPSSVNRKLIPTWKLYVSPQPEALPEAFSALIDTLPGTTATSFKVGSDACGVLRPDKMVVYFRSFEELAQAAELLAPTLTQLPAHGVPFTSEIAGNGLLSWGMDPPRADQLLSSQPSKSWRRWVVERLAFSLAQARRESSSLPPWLFALERLRLEGVDVDSWTPSLSLFDATQAEV